MNTQKYVTEKNNTDRNRFSRYCMKAAAGALTLVMIGGCVSAINPLSSGDSGWAIEASAAETDSWLNEDGSLKDGRYSLPLALKNSNMSGNDSMAADCIVGAEITVKNKQAVVTIDLQSKTMGTITAWASNWKIHQEYSLESEVIAADYTTDSEGNVNQITFSLPENAYQWGGVFADLSVDIGTTVMNVDAWLSMDFANAEPIAISLEDSVYAVDGTMQKPDGTASMSDGAIARAIKLTVEDGEYFLTMNFKALDVGGLLG